MSELRKVSPERIPPPGGLFRLQKAIAAQRPAGIAWRWLATAASLALLALLSPLWTSLPPHDDGIDSAVRGALQGHIAGEAVQVNDGAALAVPSGHPNVRIYLVQSLPSKDPDARP